MSKDLSADGRLWTRRTAAAFPLDALEGVPAPALVVQGRIPVDTCTCGQGVWRFSPTCPEGRQVTATFGPRVAVERGSLVPCR